jgi:hypothetical protein
MVSWRRPIDSDGHSDGKIKIRNHRGPTAHSSHSRRRHAGEPKVKGSLYCWFGPIVRNTGESRKLYREVLGIPFKEEADGYLHSEAVPAAESFEIDALADSLDSNQEVSSRTPLAGV